MGKVCLYERSIAHGQTKDPAPRQGPPLPGRTLDVLRRQGVRFPENANPRKTAEFKAEYQRQLNQFRRERAAKKASKKSPIDPPKAD